ncbi:MAG TPA: tetratricopeptide repeat protein [Gallionella sp.]|nr:tetratricopeptide repeat protein [Gallionella sp.]
MHSIGRGLGLVVLLLFSGNALTGTDSLLAQADKLLRAGKAQEAYALLEPLQAERAGDPNYDYLLGAAALDSSKPNKAVFALERVLAVNPEHVPARIEIARAYFATGETVAAQQEFETVRKYNPPREINEAIGKYLDAIEQARAMERTSVQGYLEAAAGSDSNVNSATASNQVAIPAFGGFIATLNAIGMKLRDTFYRVTGGFNARRPFTPEWAMFGGANYNRRFNSTQTTFDTGVLDGNLGINLIKGADSYSLALQGQSFDLDNSCYRLANGLTAQWLRNLDKNSQASVYFQYSDLHYPGQDVRDARRYIAGVAYAHALGGKYSPVIYAGAYGGQERERRSDVPYLGHKPYGLRAGGELKLAPQATLFGSASIEWRDYHGQDPLFQVTRKDTQAVLTAGVGYVPAKNWTITPSISLTRNRSNIVIDDYNRAVFGVTVRRDLD